MSAGTEKAPIRILSALLLIVSRQVREGAHTALPLLWSALGLTLVSTIGLLTQAQEPPLALLSSLSVEAWLLLLLPSLLSSLATLLLLLALAWVPPGKAALLASSSLLFSYTVQLASGAGAPAWPDLAGAACLLLTLLCTGLEGLVVEPQRWRWL